MCRVRRWGKRLVRGAIVLCIATAGHWRAARAEDLDHDEDGWHPARFELSVGAQAFRDAWALYTGMTAAPLGGLDGGWSAPAGGRRLRRLHLQRGAGQSGVGSRIREFEGEDGVR